MNTVYGLVDPRTGYLRYIGVTKQPVHLRYQEHCRRAKADSKLRVARWIHQVQSRGYRPVLVTLEVAASRDRECFWVALFRSTGCDLTNLTDGGEGVPMNEDIRRRISQSLKGHVMTPEAKAKLIAARQGMKFSDEHRQHISEAQRGRPVTADQRARISAALKGRSRPAEVRTKIGEAQKGRCHTPRTPEITAKIAAALRGRKRIFTPEHCRHISEAKRRSRPEKG